MPGMVVKNLLPNGGAFNGDESLVESVNNSPTKQTPIIRLFSAEKPSTQLFPSGPLAQNAGGKTPIFLGGQTCLVGGSNPFENDALQIGSFPQVFGENIKISLNPKDPLDP